MAEAEGLCGEDGDHDDFVEITMLKKGDTIHYVVASFPVVKVELVEVKLQWEEYCEGLPPEIHVFDGFARSCPNIDHPLPAIAHVPFNYDCAFIINREEFGRSVDISPYTFFKHDVFVLWQWTWLNDTPSTSPSPSPIPHSSSCTPDVISVSQTTSESEDDDIPAITHTVIFKCIGAHKETAYQDQLKLAKQKLQDGNPVVVKLNLEPQNPRDSKAIAFICKIDDGEWKRIGYVVKEAVDDVHTALNEKKILNVAFNWIRFKLYETPAWYAGIKITRNCEWSQRVLLSRSPS
ncbi:uncharacterized protein [Dysidea avara]|uniref:uncharacterized protein n=1 Tax=Dysidea avara TaxID=196820 RepID=UPI003331C1CE